MSSEGDDYMNNNPYYKYFRCLDNLKIEVTNKNYHETLYNHKFLDHEKLIKENRKPKIDLIRWPGTHYKHFDYFWLYWQPSNWIYYNKDGEKERIDIYENGKFFYEKHLN